MVNAKDRSNSDGLRLAAKALAGLALALLIQSSPVLALEQGEQSPDFTLASNIGRDVKLSDYRGKVVFVDFWTSWCTTCQKSLSWANKFQRELSNPDFQVLTINLDETPDGALQFLQKEKMNLLVAYDPSGSTPEAYQVEATPTSMLIGPDGKIELIHSGFDDKASSEIEFKISGLLKKDQ
ncbi:MAG: TlpA family protein disulfide reductase [Oligoflexia bacterium]|nr:TlpA family protein disulfide reductase [Oligoflexia bacterium]